MFAGLLKLVPFRDYLYGAIAVAGVIFWFHHNAVERKIGAQLVQAAVAAANKKADEQAQKEIATLAHLYQQNLSKVQATYEKQLATATAQHNSDLQRLLDIEAHSGGTSNPNVGGSPGTGQGSTPGTGGAPAVGGLPTDLYVPASVALNLTDALRHDDAQLQACWAERDSLTGK